MAPPRSLLPVAAWPDRASLGRAVHPRALRQLLHLRCGSRGRAGSFRLEWNAVFFYFRPGAVRSALGVRLRIPSSGRDTAPVTWVGSADGVAIDDAHRILWFLLNEVCWRPGAVVFEPGVVEHLTVDPHTHDLDRHPEAFGSPLVDPEPWQLLEEPPPAIQPLEAFVRHYQAR